MGKPQKSFGSPMSHIASSMTRTRSLIFDAKLIKYTFDQMWRPIIKCGCADKSAYPIFIISKAPICPTTGDAH